VTYECGFPFQYVCSTARPLGELAPFVIGLFECSSTVTGCIQTATTYLGSRTIYLHASNGHIDVYLFQTLGESTHS
jgi:hypothetical protein